MLRIRLTRTGKRNQPTFRIVVADHRRAVKGKHIEVLGHYNPRSKELVLDRARASHWVSQGAQASDTVAKLIAKPAPKAAS